MKDCKQIPVPVITGTLSFAPKKGRKENGLDSPSRNSLDFDLCSENNLEDVGDPSLSCISKSIHPILPPVRLTTGIGNKMVKRNPIGVSSLRTVPQKEFCLDILTHNEARNESQARESGSRDVGECIESFPIASLSMVSLSLSEDTSPHHTYNSTITSSFKPFRSKPLSKTISAYSVHSLSSPSLSQSPNNDFKANIISTSGNRVADTKVEQQTEEESPNNETGGASHAYDIDYQYSGDEFNRNHESIHSVLTSPSEIQASSDPVPYQVHNRILGWKLTSIKRRQDLIDILDIIHNPDDPRLRLSMKSLSSSLKNKMTTSTCGDESGLKHRQSVAMEKYLSRSLKSRQSFKSPTTIKSLMEEKRKAIRSRDHAIHEKNIPNDLGESVKRRVSTPILARSLSKNDKFGVQVDLNHIETLAASWIEDEPIDQTSRAQSPLQRLYDFPVNIHKPRERMDILESVRFRETLEGSVFHHTVSNSKG